MKKIAPAIAAALTSIVVSGVAAEDAVQWRVEDGGNGHWYQVIDSGEPWTVGRHAAAADLQGATLASFSTAEEQARVEVLLAEQMDGVPSGERLMVHAIGYCGDCTTYWRDRIPVTDGWGRGQPDWSSDFLIAQLDAESFTLMAAAVNTTARMAVREWEADCNDNGIVDYGEILEGLVADADSNWIPDPCDTYTAANLIANGSFEANPVNQCCTSAANWSGSIDLVWMEWFADDGGISIDLNTGSAGTIQQVVSIREAGTYRLAFSMAGNDCGNSPALKRMRGELGPLSEEFEHQIRSGEPELAGEWSRFVRDIELPAGSHTLAFESLVGGCGGPAIDAVSLTSMADCDHDGLPDIEQIRNGTHADVDGNGVPDCCEGAGPCPCRADLDGDGQVRAGDLGILLSLWGNDGGKRSEADLDGSGTIDAADLGLMIAAWGECD